MVLKWLREEGEPQREQALQIEELYTAGLIRVVVPSLFFAEVLNIVSRKWKRSNDNVRTLGESLSEFGFEVRDPAFGSGVAQWCAEGLSGYDATYAALASETNYLLVTADSRLAEVAGEHARSLSDVEPDTLVTP